ncbi:MAG TPA: SDR family NAD(P)-dependent oxidoreductase [Candidatus Limiplasma sp.]|nr:SDR family NAD(P)-dependent oxidoreductase [Candidatus Limiplasma sp.]HPS82383.1 SDR family NAD(P)-dependent oxidoreductase [Candidatus Limiplasma sp.]
MEKGTVWVIGASSGLGLATAEAFAADGWQVISGARSFGVHSEKDAVHTSIHPIGLDVTVAESREAFAQSAFAISPRVDALVYCAAVLMLGPCEETSPDEYAQVMQTNFVGLTAMVSLVLPAMRSRQQGKIILFSSINGLLGIPFQSAYTASKHAVEGYAECLAMEVKPHGIQVCLVEPGDHRGGSQHTRLRTHRGEEASPYEPACGIATGIIHRDESNGLSPIRLGAKVVQNANRKRMRIRLRVAKPDQRLAVVLHDLLTPSLNFWILRDYYGKGGRA